MGDPSETRGRLLEATARLLWEQGYEATSPKAIMAESGAGQGSFYHHFDSKKALAVAALTEASDELVQNLAIVFDERKPGLERVQRWLDIPRKALAGCRLGRLSMEKSVIDDDDLRTPLLRYFKAAERALVKALEDAETAGELAVGVDPGELAVTLLAIVQGGYVVARAHRDADKLREAIRGAKALLAASRR